MENNKTTKRMNTMNAERSHSEQQAINQLESIREMVAKLANEETREQAMEEIQEDPLSVEVRSGWHPVGETHISPVEYRILLCTGGPACRIEGELNSHLEPESARLMHQDWGTPWMEYTRDEASERDADEKTLLTYAQQFFYGE